MSETAQREESRDQGLAWLAGTSVVIGFYLTAMVALLMTAQA